MIDLPYQCQPLVVLLGDNAVMANNNQTLQAPPAPWVTYGIAPKMGLRACDESQWLLEDDHFGDRQATGHQIALKSDLCRTHHEAIFQAMPEADEATGELFEMIADNVKRFHNLSLAAESNQHPLDTAGRALADDLCLLAPEKVSGDAKETEKWLLKAAFLGFPAHWSLAEKFNQPMGAIHAPVPDYDQYLETPVDRFFSKMVAGTISKRRNWTLQIDDGLFTPKRTPAKPLTTAEVATRLYVRVETQTLRKLPRTGWIIFTIRTAIAPMSRWADDKDALSQLPDILSALSPAMRDYRGIESYEAQLCKWVTEQVG